MAAELSTQGSSLLASLLGPYTDPIPSVSLTLQQQQQDLHADLWPHCRSAVLNTRYSDPLVLLLLLHLLFQLLLLLLAFRGRELRFQFGVLLLLLGCISSSQLLQWLLSEYQTLLLQHGWLSGYLPAPTEIWVFVFWVLPLLLLLLLLNLLLLRQLLKAVAVALRARLRAATASQKQQQEQQQGVNKVT